MGEIYILGEIYVLEDNRDISPSRGKDVCHLEAGNRNEAFHDHGIELGSAVGI